MLCPNCHSQTHNFCRRRKLLPDNESAAVENSVVEEG